MVSFCLEVLSVDQETSAGTEVCKLQGKAGQSSTLCNSWKNVFWWCVCTQYTFYSLLPETICLTFCFFTKKRSRENFGREQLHTSWETIPCCGLFYFTLAFPGKFREVKTHSEQIRAEVGEARAQSIGHHSQWKYDISLLWKVPNRPKSFS